jgi:hypothetical protein
VVLPGYLYAADQTLRNVSQIGRLSTRFPRASLRWHIDEKLIF